MFLFFLLSYYEIKYQYNAVWLKVFFHNSSSQIFFKNSSEALNSNTFHKFSILNEINNNFLINKKFEFLLEYPEVSGYNRWVQSINPIYQSDSTITGYLGIHISWSGRFWGGLSLGSGGYSFLDGSIRRPDWWFAIGSYISYGEINKYPGPAVSESSSSWHTVSICYLWIRIDGTKFKFESKPYKIKTFQIKKMIYYFLFLS